MKKLSIYIVFLLGLMALPVQAQFIISPFGDTIDGPNGGEECPTTPPKAPSISNNCGSTTITRSIEFLSNETIYWQTYSSGTSTANSSVSRTFTNGSFVYLRKRNDETGCWGPARLVSYTITSNPSRPPVVIPNQQQCDVVTLNRGNPPFGITYYWQSSPGGTSTANSASSITRTSGAVYYLRARNNSSGCWSSARIIYYSISTPPATPSTPSISTNCGSTVLTRSTPPSGITWYWQSSFVGTSTANASTSIVRSSGSTYYLRARNNSTGCWGTARSVNYTINTPPATPATVNVQYQNESTVLSRSNPPSGVSWYWQNSSGGTSITNSASSITRTSGSTYYLRARNNSTGCWGTARIINYAIFSSPGTPPIPANIGQSCSGASIQRANPPSGVIWYWQGTNTSGTSTTNAQSIYNLNTSGTYYLRARHTESGLWSTNSSSITVTFGTIGGSTWYADTDGDGLGDPNVSIISCSQPSGYVSNADDQCPNIAGTTGNNGCVPVPPTTPTTPVNIGQICTGASLLRGNPPAGVTWYWQETNASGTSLANAESVYNLHASGTYYLRARDNESGLWSTNSSSITITLGTIGGSTWYADTDGDALGDPNVSTVSCNQPSGYVSNADDQCPDEAGNGTANGCPDTSIDPVALSDVNYVYTRVPQVAMTVIDETTVNEASDIIDQVSYFDGLGRLSQNIAIQQSPQGNDIISHCEYDEFGRKAKEHLPYVTGGDFGTFRTNDQDMAVKGYYNTHYAEDFVGVPVADINAYSEKLFENSPLNRVLKQATPGADWKLGNNHEVLMDYDVNSSEEVRFFDVNFSGGNTEAPQLISSGTAYYDAGELNKVILKDENWQLGQTYVYDHTVEEFTDKDGQVILKRTYNENIPHDTYYVYDDYGNLTYVIPPKVVTTDGVSAIERNELCYQYRYDFKNRLVEKKIPGKDWEYIIYNKLDQPVMTQDAHLRTDNRWLVTKYDAFGRVAYTGFTVDASSRSSIQNFVNTDTTSASYETRLRAGIDTPIEIDEVAVYYTKESIPVSITEVLTINYYDDYSFDLDGLTIPIGPIYDQPITIQTQGLATGSKVKVLDTPHWITTLIVYDTKARPIGVYSKNEALNTTDIVESKLDFTGKVLETSSTHTKDNQVPIVITERYTYDQATRLLTQTHQIGSGTEEVIAHNSYDELGLLVDKGVGNTIGNTRLQTVDYSYNVRGWMTAINDVNNLGDDLWGFKIKYNDSNDPSKRLYNGNISQTFWDSQSINSGNNPISQHYTYSYDALNRITEAVENTGNYNIGGINYDKNGNILTLNRTGHLSQSATAFGYMDILQYTYDSGNKLLKVKDFAVPTGFSDGIDQTIEYTYDSNGNMLEDRNKGISGISYNYLNLPTSVPINKDLNIGRIEYVYDALGTKLEKRVINTGGIVTTQYAGNFVYENEVLQFFNTTEGYVEPDGNQEFSYTYQYKDHLGNIRLSYSDMDDDGNITSAEIKEENNYYPFGLKHRGYNNNQIGRDHKFEYNGKEFEESLGYNMLEMNFRHHDPELGRWIVIDPVTHHSMSPYNAFDNNPIFWADPSGADSFVYYNGRSHLITNDMVTNVYTAGESNEESGGNNNSGGNNTECKKCKTEYQAKNYDYTANDRRAKNGYHTDGGHFISYGGKEPDYFYKATTSSSNSSVVYTFKTQGSIELVNDNTRKTTNRLNLLSSILLGTLTGGISAELQLSLGASQLVSAGTAVGSYVIGPVQNQNIVLDPGDSIEVTTTTETFRSTTNEDGFNGIIINTQINIVRNNIKYEYSNSATTVNLDRNSRLLSIMEDRHGKSTTETIENPKMLPFSFILKPSK